MYEEYAKWDASWVEARRVAQANIAEQQKVKSAFSTGTPGKTKVSGRAQPKLRVQQFGKLTQFESSINHRLIHITNPIA